MFEIFIQNFTWFGMTWDQNSVLKSWIVFCMNSLSLEVYIDNNWDWEQKKERSNNGSCGKDEEEVVK